MNRRAARRQAQRELLARMDRLEEDIAEVRRHHTRLAELTDVVQELLVPLASRDQQRIDEAIDRFSQSL